MINNNTPYLLTTGNIAKIQGKEVTSEGKKTIKPKYNDPLNDWPARGLAYTNEVGAAISEVAPKTGLMLWVPALLYFGADIYDKYKNDKNSYDPSGKRGTKQAIFQLLASVLLPTAAVKVGQKTASALALCGKNRLTLQSQEELHHFTIDYMKQNKLRDYADKQDEFIKKFNTKLGNHIEETNTENKFKNSIKSFSEWLFNRRQPDSVTHTTSDKIYAYTDNNLKQIFKMREELLNEKKPKEFSKKLFNKFLTAKNEFATMKEYQDDIVGHAAKHVLKLYQEQQIFHNKMLKTVGGFVALGLLVKPIDMFVEHYIIKKVIEPGLTKFDNMQVKEFKEKVLSKDVENADSKQA